MSWSEGTGRGVDVGTAGLGCSTTTVGVAVGSVKAVGGVSPAWQAIREASAPQVITPAINVDCRIVIGIKKSLGSPQHRLTGDSRYPWWGDCGGTFGMYNSKPKGKSPISSPCAALRRPY